MAILDLGIKDAHRLCGSFTDGTKLIFKCIQGRTSINSISALGLCSPQFNPKLELLFSGLPPGS